MHSATMMSQSRFFGHLTGDNPTSGTSFPNMVKVGCAYGIPSQNIDRESQFEQIDQVFSADGPSLIVVVLDPTQEFEPRSKARRLPDGANRFTQSRGHVPIPGPD